MTCDNQCEECGKYTTVKYNGGKYTEYSCILANKDVKVIYDDCRIEKKCDNALFGWLKQEHKSNSR